MWTSIWVGPDNGDDLFGDAQSLLPRLGTSDEVTQLSFKGAESVEHVALDLQWGTVLWYLLWIGLAAFHYGEYPRCRKRHRDLHLPLASLTFRPRDPIRIMLPMFEGKDET